MVNGDVCVCNSDNSDIWNVRGHLLSITDKYELMDLLALHIKY